MLTGRIKVNKSDLIEVIKKAKQNYEDWYEKAAAEERKKFDNDNEKHLKFLKSVADAINKDLALVEKGKKPVHLDKLNTRYYNLAFYTRPFQVPFNKDTKQFDSDLHILELSVEDVITIGVTSQFARYF